MRYSGKGIKGGTGIPEIDAINTRYDGITDVDDDQTDDPTETPQVKEQRRMMEALVQMLTGEEPQYDDKGNLTGWFFAGGVAAGQEFVIRRPDGVADYVLTAPISYTEQEADVNYSLELRRAPDGTLEAVTFNLIRHQEHSNQFTPEQLNVPLPKALQGKLTSAGREMAARLRAIRATAATEDERKLAAIRDLLDEKE